ncbi:MAG: FmdB family zinc ribbon protein, partial [Chthoniobacterales bacterium]
VGSVWSRATAIRGASCPAYFAGESAPRVPILAVRHSAPYIHAMPTYVYETVKRPARRYEIKQSMKDSALRVHPETGEEIRRVITGGLGFMSKGSGTVATPIAAKGCGHGSCGCH